MLNKKWRAHWSCGFIIRELPVNGVRERDSGFTVETWIAFLNDEGTASNSIYTGELTV